MNSKAYSQRWYAKNREQILAKRRNKTKSDPEYRARRSRIVMQSKLRHKDRVVASAAAYREVNKEKTREKYKLWYRDHSAMELEKCRGRRLKLKADVMEKYGGYCAYCSSRELAILSIDHKNDDGAIKRGNNEDDPKSCNFYRLLLKTPRRNDLQVLCMACQWRKRAYGRDFSTWESKMVLLNPNVAITYDI